MCVYAFVLKISSLCCFCGELLPFSTSTTPKDIRLEWYVGKLAWDTQHGASEWQKDTHTHMRSRMFHIPLQNVKKFDCKQWSFFCFHFLCFSNISVENYAYETERPCYVNPMAFHVIVKLVYFFLFLCFSCSSHRAIPSLAHLHSKAKV